MTAQSGPAAPPENALTLEGKPVNPLARAASNLATVLVFISDDCPISNRYAPELNRLHKLFIKTNVAFYLVHPNPDTTTKEAADHAREYQLAQTVLLDPQHFLVKKAGATVTPEVAVFDKSGAKVYVGRIDDRYVAFGKARREPTTHDLEEVLNALLTGKPAARPAQPAIGCYIVKPGK